MAQAPGTGTACRSSIISRTPRGKHAFKFGGEIHRNAPMAAHYGDARGALQFSAVGHDGQRLHGAGGFLCGDPRKRQSSPDSRALATSHNWAYALFLPGRLARHAEI